MEDYRDRNQEILDEKSIELGKLHDNYCKTFIDSVHGKEVLAHLKSVHYFEFDSIYVYGQPGSDSAFKLGQRYVIASLLKFLDQSPDQFKQQPKIAEEQ